MANVETYVTVTTFKKSEDANVILFKIIEMVQCHAVGREEECE
jgi:hypothetical protein